MPSLKLEKYWYYSSLNKATASQLCTLQQSFLVPVLRIRIRDPGLVTFLTPGSGMGESQHQDPGSGMNNPDNIL
jgi:hypothetical protein